MKKIIVIILTVAGVGIAYWLISPLFINKKVEEKFEDITKAEQSPSSQATSSDVVAQGSFIGLGGHHAEGSTKLIKIADKYYVRFEDDFRVTNGPDLFVYFGKNGKYDASARIANLKGNIGGQNYEIPAGINPVNFNEIWVWCRTFSVAFGKAVIQ